MEQTVSYGLEAYKQEGYEMFTEMIERVQTTTITRLLKGKIIRIRPGMPIPGRRPAAPAPSAQSAQSAAQPVPAQLPAQPSADGAPNAPADGGKAQPETEGKTAEPATAPVTEGAPESGAAEEGGAQTAPAPTAPERKPFNVQRVPIPGGLATRPQEFTPNPTGKQAPLVKNKKKEPGRNDPCPCGSGKKYKDCCYWKNHR